MSETSTGQGHPGAQTLHDRAAESARETRQLVVAMSTGSIGVFFLAISGGGDAPDLSTFQVVVIILAIAQMAMAVFSGLWSAYSDAQWSYSWARAIQAGLDNEPATAWNAARHRWHGHKRWSERASLGLFATGVITASVYLATLIVARLA